MAIFIPTTGHIRTVSPKHGMTFTIEEIRQLVGGQPICIQLRAERRLWINQHGKLQRLSPNPLATLLARSVAPGTWLVGPALLMTRREAGA